MLSEYTFLPLPAMPSPLAIYASALITVAVFTVLMAGPIARLRRVFYVPVFVLCGALGFVLGWALKRAEVEPENLRIIATCDYGAPTDAYAICNVPEGKITVKKVAGHTNTNPVVIYYNSGE